MNITQDEEAATSLRERNVCTVAHSNDTLYVRFVNSAQKTEE